MGLPKRRMTTSAQVRSMMKTTAAAETLLIRNETRSIDFAIVRSTDDFLSAGAYLYCFLYLVIRVSACFTDLLPDTPFWSAFLMYSWIVGLTAFFQRALSCAGREMIWLPRLSVKARPSLSASSQALPCTSTHSRLVSSKTLRTSGGRAFHFLRFMTTKNAVVYPTSKQSVVDLITSACFQPLSTSMGPIVPSTIPLLSAS